MDITFKINLTPVHQELRAKNSYASSGLSSSKAYRGLLGLHFTKSALFRWDFRALLQI